MTNCLHWAAMLRIAVVVFAGAGIVSAQKPNFVFVLVDDLGWRDLGSLSLIHI